ncbi:MAG: hypothetical protein ACTHKG_01475 [Nocardioides sp.]
MLVIIQRVPAASVLVLSLVAGLPAAEGSATDSCLWRKHVIDVYHANVGPTWRVRRAVRVWNDVHQGQPRLRTVTSKAAADVIVSPYREAATDIKGWTLDQCEKDRVTRSTVRLNAARPLDFADRAKVTVHELGHVLGLRDRTSRARPTVMNAFLRRCRPTPTALDRQALGSIY